VIPAWDLWGRWVHDLDPEPDRETITGTAYLIDWQRRRLIAVPVDGPRCTLCLHAERLDVFCPECSADLDALATDLLP
jgi:hypothetical protein